MEAVIKRSQYGEKQTLGSLIFYGELGFPFLSLKTLELPWKDNKNGESCIPEGDYMCRKRLPEESGTFDVDHFLIYDPELKGEKIEGNGYTRKYILIHPANYYTQLAGCVAPGREFEHINEDGIIDIVGSRDSLEQIFFHTTDYLKDNDEKFSIRVESAKDVTYDKQN